MPSSAENVTSTGGKKFTEQQAREGLAAVNYGLRCLKISRGVFREPASLKGNKLIRDTPQTYFDALAEGPINKSVQIGIQVYFTKDLKTVLMMAGNTAFLKDAQILSKKALNAGKGSHLTLHEALERLIQSPDEAFTETVAEMLLNMEADEPNGDIALFLNFLRTFDVYHEQMNFRDLKDAFISIPALSTMCGFDIGANPTLAKEKLAPLFAQLTKAIRKNPEVKPEPNEQDLEHAKDTFLRHNAASKAGKYYEPILATLEALQESIKDTKNIEKKVYIAIIKEAVEKHLKKGEITPLAVIIKTDCQEQLMALEERPGVSTKVKGELQSVRKEFEALSRKVRTTSDKEKELVICSPEKPKASRMDFLKQWSKEKVKGTSWTGTMKALAREHGFPPGATAEQCRKMLPSRTKLAAPRRKWGPGSSSKA